MAEMVTGIEPSDCSWAELAEISSVAALDAVSVVPPSVLGLDEVSVVVVVPSLEKPEPPHAMSENESIKGNSRRVVFVISMKCLFFIIVFRVRKCGLRI
jgi:hypothetical protein